MATIKDQLQSDLSTAMKARDDLRSGTIRMVLAAITNEEVSGKQARQLSDDDVMTVLGREAKKRREAAEAYDAGSALEPENKMFKSLAEKSRAVLGYVLSVRTIAFLPSTSARWS